MPAKSAIQFDLYDGTSCRGSPGVNLFAGGTCSACPVTKSWYETLCDSNGDVVVYKYADSTGSCSDIVKAINKTNEWKNDRCNPTISKTSRVKHMCKRAQHAMVV